MISVLLDSSNTKLLVAIADENKIIDQVSYEAWQQQSEFMVPELDNLLVKHNYSKDDISKVVVAIGPGSYTGVRIAVTIAKVIALALDVPVIALSSLHILADLNKPSICLINARSERSYIGVFEQEKVLLVDQIMNNEDVKKYIKSHPTYLLKGDIKYLGFNNSDSNVAGTMLFLSAKNKEEINPLSLKPVYLKD